MIFPFFGKDGSIHAYTWVRGTSSHGLHKKTDVRSWPIIGWMTAQVGTDGTRLHPFHSGLFESVIQRLTVIWPVGLIYRRPDGSINRHCAFTGEQSFVDSLLTILAQPPICLEIWIGDPIASMGLTRRRLAHKAQTVIASQLQLPVGSGFFKRFPHVFTPSGENGWTHDV